MLARTNDAVPGTEEVIRNIMVNAEKSGRRTAIENKIRNNPTGTITNREAAIFFDVSVKTIRSWVNKEVESKSLEPGVKRATVRNESILRLEQSTTKSSSE